jgi:hypothetical protein
MSDVPVRVQGLNDFTEQPAKRRYNLGTGWVTTRTWEGPNDDNLVRQQEDYLRTLGALSVDTDASIPCKISGTFPDAGGLSVTDDDANSEANAVWELNKMEVDKRLSSHPKWNYGESATRLAQAKEIARIDKDIRQKESYDPATESEPYKSYAMLSIQGVSSYMRFTYMLRQSYSLRNASSKKLTFENTMKVISYGAIGVPGTVKWSEPKYLEWNGTIFTATPLQWLELPADFVWNTRTKKVDITRTWQGAVEFSGTLYDGGSAP